MCQRCGYVACVCRFKREHKSGCTRRKAVLCEGLEPDKKPDPCKAHGVYACDRCFPCDCKEPKP